jgi:hypothetical protein
MEYDFDLGLKTLRNGEQNFLLNTDFDVLAVPLKVLYVMPTVQ